MIIRWPSIRLRIGIVSTLPSSKATEKMQPVIRNEGKRCLRKSNHFRKH
jgi:hypothetical protein